MRERYFNVGLLVRIQQVSWYVVLTFFAATAVLYLLDFPEVFNYTKYGITLILLAAVAQLIVMAEQFRLSNLKQFWLLSYFLVLVLVAVAVLKYWL